MNTAEFLTAYRESRNGANQFYRHPLVRSFIYSDGVKECADAGLYWLLDILATECLKPVRTAEQQGIVSMRVRNGTANLSLSFEDDAPDAWSKKIDWTDAPDGDYSFVIGPNEVGVSMILLSEY